MEIDIDRFMQIQNATGLNSRKEQKIEEVRSRFAGDFDSSINVVYDATHNGVAQDFIIVNTKEKNKYSVFIRPNETPLLLGDLIEWNNLHWLITEKDYHSEIYGSCTMELCNRLIRWQNPKTYNIVERWAIFSRPYSANMNTGNVISTMKGKYDIIVPYDSETEIVPVDKRFMIDVIDDQPMVYRVTFPDLSTLYNEGKEGGLVKWNVDSDVYSADSDNKELMICDYQIKPDESNTPVAGLKCEINGRSNIRVGASNRIYTPLFYAEDNLTVVSGISPIWELKVPARYENDFVCRLDSEGKYYVEAKDNAALIGQVITLTLSDRDGLYKPSSINIVCEVM